MARVLVMKPAGEFAPGQGVVSHHVGAPDRSVKHFYNIGDLYVYDSSLRLISMAQLSPVRNLRMRSISAPALVR